MHCGPIPERSRSRAASASDLQCASETLYTGTDRLLGAKCLAIRKATSLAPTRYARTCHADAGAPQGILLISLRGRHPTILHCTELVHVQAGRETTLGELLRRKPVGEVQEGR